MTTTTERTVASLAAKEYTDRLTMVVLGLRRLADEVEREGRPAGGNVGDTPQYANAASRAFHALIWGFANLKADALIDTAGRADNYAAKEADEQEPANPPIGWAKHNGAGEIVFRQAAHPANDAHLGPEWKAVYLR